MYPPRLIFPRSLQFAHLQIVDEILTMRCPRCSQAFVDFSDCAALTCSRCHAAICAFCQTDCGRDAHAHVRNCPDGVGSIFVGVQEFEARRRMRQRRLVEDFLKRLPAEMGQQVRALLRNNLEDFD
mmetsp:Transcript_24672/g.61913  ORF Transcript_24672/g.61913 Transcript_24672/m.61913 type:complete len:126 (-) Transcript_24672:136-513(-)